MNLHGLALDLTGDVQPSDGQDKSDMEKSCGEIPNADAVRGVCGVHICNYRVKRQTAPKSLN